MQWAVWSNGAWLPGWGGQTGAIVYSFLIDETHTYLTGTFTSPSIPGRVVINNIGSARAYPIFTITGPGQLLYIVNYATNQVIYFDITLVASETLTIDLSPGAKTVTSSFRGNLINGVLAGALVNWYLTLGINYVGAYVDDPTATGIYTYTPLYWGID
jgi:hypothetical protein